VTASRRLEAKLELARGALDEAAAPAWLGSDAGELYGEYLASLYAVARGAVPLMMRALARCEELAASGDPVAAGLAPFLGHHIPEEQGHDTWLLEDIAALGGDVESVRSLPLSATVAAMSGAQLWWIEHAHPVGFLGHAEVLECSPPEAEMLDEFERRTGVPAAAMRFFRRHAVIDVRHREEIHQILDELPLTAEQEALIGVSALHTAGMLVRLYGELRLPAREAV
jgi:Iron-containing redox enzyme